MKMEEQEFIATEANGLYMLVETDSVFALTKMEMWCAWLPNTIWQRQGGYRQQNAFPVQNAIQNGSEPETRSEYDMQF
ncbi:unnamed protein product [Phytophthora fragariaefolia]|uniref:Unnamed protein product n=1 Tax=Phytophthora fragariaefolia TaxID=1490495 RepID=A0A9W6XZF4_9STRA|nr:unnamed protein product [Phytophthora fragariaefolia]